MKLKANLLDDNAIRRSLIRISHEIIEKNKEKIETLLKERLKKYGDYDFFTNIQEIITKTFE